MSAKDPGEAATSRGVTNLNVSEIDMAQDSRPCKGCGEPVYRTVAVAPIKHYHGPECRPRCTVEGCGKPRQGDAYCTAHHQKWRRHGDPLFDSGRTPNVGPCSVEGCDQPMRHREWCSSHYGQWRRNGEVRPFKYKWASRDGDCYVCGEPVPPGSRRRKYCSAGCQQAGVRQNGARPRIATCGFCSKAFSLTSRTASGRLQRSDTVWCPDCGRDSPDVQRFKNYGVTRDQFDAATLAGCEICGRTDKTLHVDHDHTCCGSGRTCGECVRGFLCGPCNRGIGLFFDNAEALARAAEYIRRQSE